MVLICNHNHAAKGDLTTTWGKTVTRVHAFRGQVSAVAGQIGVEIGSGTWKIYAMANSIQEFFAEEELVAVLTTQPLGRFLDYKAPAGGLRLGAFVDVPLGPRRVLGVVWGPGMGGFDPAKIRRVNRVLDLPPMRREMQQFLTRAADYTVSSLEAMLRLATRMPGIMDKPGVRKVLRLGDAVPDRMTNARERVLAVMEDHGDPGFAASELAALAGTSTSVIKGLIQQDVIVEMALPRDAPFARLDVSRPGKPLSTDQRRAADHLKAGIQSRSYGTTLLRGVTGSGKTEVYLESVAETLRQGRQALVLLPEIALTVDFLARIEARFGARPAEWHSGITQAERRRAFRAVANGSAEVIVGARSSLFLPFADLGLIVVDEEHDGSYKQEDVTLYNARDMAVLRAAFCNARVILSSATPSLESWANAESGKYARIDLTERFGDAVLPKMAAIDLRAEEMARNRWISPSLVGEIRTRIGRGEQSLIFLNRRGYAPLTVCRKCGHQIGCDDCDARMVEHRFLARLVCHQCGANRPMPDACPECSAEDTLAAVGPGVERLAEEVTELFPEARIALLSSDIADSARKLKERIRDIADGAADIIIGTQLVAKGHNFPLLTLVGVIDADLGLQGGDLRAAEKSFQLLRQVAGRAGRKDRPGTAFLQTHQPDHPVIAAILSDADEAFWKAEAAARHAAGSPPYGRMAGIVVSGPDERQVFDLATDMSRRIGPLVDIGAQVFGPAAAPVARIRGRFRVRLLIKTAKGAPIQDALRQWAGQFAPPPNMRVSIDIDPQSFY